MKKFILNIILFGLCLLLVNKTLFSIQKQFYLEPYGKFELKYQTYLLADSHGEPLKNFTEEYGIFNFSMGSDSYLDMLRKIKFLILIQILNSVW